MLCLLIEGFEEIETVTPIDLLRRAGVDVVVASVSGALSVTGRSHLTLQADAALAGAEAQEFDLLFLPGGPGVGALRRDGRAARLARKFYDAGKLVAAICAAPTVLQDAGLLKEKKFTAHFSVHGELQGALGDERVVEDGMIVTSRGAGTAVDFGLTLVRKLCGETKAREIADAIMA